MMASPSVNGRVTLLHASSDVKVELRPSDVLYLKALLSTKKKIIIDPPGFFFLHCVNVPRLRVIHPKQAKMLLHRDVCILEGTISPPPVSKQKSVKFGDFAELYPR